MVKFFNKRIFIIFIFPLLLGALSTLSFQPYNFFLLNFFSLPSLFYLIVYVKKKSKSTYRKKPFLKNLFILGTSYGFGFFLFGLYWISHSLTFDDTFKFLIPFSLIFIPLFLSLFFSLPIILVGSFIDENLSSIFLISLVFALSDFLRNFLLNGFPWNLWAYSFSWSHESLQVLSTIGIFSFNLLLITFFFIPSSLFFKKKIKYIIVIFFGILFLGNYFYGSYKINSYKENESEKINFKIVSARMNLSEFKDIEQAALKLIKNSNPDRERKTIFVWPEGVFFGENFNNLENLKPLFENSFSKNHLIIFGANTSKNINDEFKYFNSLVIVDNELNIISKYDKRKLVPFGEFLPFENILNKFGLKKIVTSHSSFSKGLNNPLLDLNFDKTNIKLLSLICYEIIFPNIISNNHNKFNFIINISEDAWFGESIGPYQHFSKAVFRSIESKTYTIRSANKGVSAFISPNGKVLKSLSPNESGNIEMQLPILDLNKGDNKKSLIFLSLLITFILTIFILKKFKI